MVSRTFELAEGTIRSVASEWRALKATEAP